MQRGAAGVGWHREEERFVWEVAEMVPSLQQLRSFAETLQRARCCSSTAW